MCTQHEAFLAFIQQYKGIITHAIRRGCGTAYPGLRPDVEQEVYLTLWKQWQNGTRLDYPVSYLYKVALRAALSMLRSHSASDPERRELPSTEQRADRWALSPAERACMLTALLDQLPTEQARAMRAYLAGFTAREVAQLYGWSPSVARHRIYWALKILRTSLSACAQ